MQRRSELSARVVRGELARVVEGAARDARQKTCDKLGKLVVSLGELERSMLTAKEETIKSVGRLVVVVVAGRRRRGAHRGGDQKRRPKAAANGNSSSGVAGIPSRPRARHGPGGHLGVARFGAGPRAG